MSASSAARRVTGPLLAAGAIVSALTLPAAAQGHDRRQYPRVEISAVRADNPESDDRSNRSLNAEWVEITNTTRGGISLRGWTLRDGYGNRYRFGDVRINSQSTIRIHTGTGRDSRTDLYQGRRDYVWDNRADTATLCDDRNRVVDTETWGDRH
ncbi:lamin tail domain-containing protein [Streptomyces lavendulae]|uniref:lamin tail domain-containing protein n=1 Tax=Streptomyces lavendulae TaxID=1914 RepID=UPI0037FC43D5